MADRPGLVSFIAALIILLIALEFLLPGTITSLANFVAANYQPLFFILIIFVILYFLTRGKR
jgi:hypothetical protein